VVAALALATAAEALNITNLTPALDGANTADGSQTTGQNFSQNTSALGTTQAPSSAPDTAGSFSEFITRYAMIVALDRQNTSGTATLNMTSSYSITFTVDNPTGASLQIDIDTLRVGSLTSVTDSAGTSTVTLGAVTGQLGGVTQAELGAPAASQSTANSVDTPFSQAGTTLTILTNAITSNYVLQFDFASSVVSAQDEGAIRMGIAGTVAASTADDYPGVGSRDPNTDGHFVTVRATVLSAPEPGPGGLTAFGLLGLALRARRARRARRR
jgi:hypothetical protein